MLYNWVQEILIRESKIQQQNKNSYYRRFENSQEDSETLLRRL